MKKIFVFVALFSSQLGYSQFNPAWRGKKAAVVLTYDDALNVHLDNAIPLLDSLGLKGTFYLTAFAPGSKNRIPDWRKAAVNGHELGNHTLYHPCVGGKGREWVNVENDMNHYSLVRMVNEVRMTNVFLQAIDGKTKRTFAFTCGDMKIGDSLFINGMKNDFVAARAVRHEMHKIGEIDLYNVDCYAVNGETGEQMIEWVKKAIETNSLLVILFHGVGGGHSLNVSSDAHRELLQYLKKNENDLMIGTMLEVAEHVNEWQVRDKQNKAIQKATQEDYNNMLAQLKIDSMRTGPSGNPSAPKAANTDESKATRYTTLPDPLILKNGKKVTDAKTWWNKRRPEIVADFDKEIYGRDPENTTKVNWEVVSTVDTTFGNIQATTKTLLGHVDNSSWPQIKVDIQLSLTVPKNVNIPVPVMMEFGFVFPPGFRFPPP